MPRPGCCRRVSSRGIGEIAAGDAIIGGDTGSATVFVIGSVKPPRFRWVVFCRGHASCMRHSGAGPATDPTACKVMQLRLRDNTALDPKPRAETLAQTSEPSCKTSEPSCKDEARIGQKGELTRQWARRGTRPRQPRDQRYQAAYLFAAACPEAEKTAALVLPQVNTEAMNLHLAEIARHVAADAHAVVILDQAGRHGGNALIVPQNLDSSAAAAYSPELNPIENLWLYLRHNFLNARVYDGYQAVVDACCDAWNRLRAVPGQIRSITTRIGPKRS